MLIMVVDGFKELIIDLGMCREETTVSVFIKKIKKSKYCYYDILYSSKSFFISLNDYVQYAYIITS